MRSGLRRVLRQALVAVALAAVVVVCLRMGWWQLERYLSAGGSLQNLGYTLQWPTFAVFAVVMWWRLRTLERTRTTDATGTTDTAAGADQPLTATMAQGAPATTVPWGRSVVTGSGTGSAATADDPDDEMAAYNRYLAGLNAAAERKKS